MVDFRSYKDLGFGLSGSSQIFVSDSKQLISKTNSNLTILDLREEPHFFIDGLGISYEIYPAERSIWYHTTRKRALDIESIILDELTSPIQLYEHKPGDIDTLDVKNPHAVPFKEKLSEKSVWEKSGIKYERATITDGQRPGDLDIDILLRIFNRALQNKSWLHVHCRDGHGRTNTIMVMFHIFLKCRSESLSQICAAHPTVDLLKLGDGGPFVPPTDKNYKTVPLSHTLLKWKVDRADMLAKFYQFCYIYFDKLQHKEGYLKKKLYSSYARRLRNEYGKN